MNLADYDYQVWRKTLHDLQVKIDEFDNKFWEGIFEKNIEDEATINELQKQYNIDHNRQKLVDEFNAHFETDPRH